MALYIRNICNLPKKPAPRQRALNWDAILIALSQNRTFVQLEHYIRANPIPDFNYVANNMLMQAEG